MHAQPLLLLFRSNPPTEGAGNKSVNVSAIYDALCAQRGQFPIARDLSVSLCVCLSVSLCLIGGRYFFEISTQKWPRPAEPAPYLSAARQEAPGRARFFPSATCEAHASGFFIAAPGAL